MINNSTDTNKYVIDHLGQLTRVLHNCLSELGYDQRLQKMNYEVANSKDGLAYIVDKTTQAAEYSLSTIENAKPILQNLTENAIQLRKRWQQIPEATVTTIKNHPALNNTLKQTLDFMDEIPKQTNTTLTYLNEIMLAQNFHDLTGQVIQKITQVIETIEQEIQQLLTEENLKKREVIVEQKNNLLNGPVTHPHKQDDVYTDQHQVDDLLNKLGF